MSPPVEKASLVESANPGSIHMQNNTAPNNTAFQVMPSTVNIVDGALHVRVPIETRPASFPSSVGMSA